MKSLLGGKGSAKEGPPEGAGQVGMLSVLNLQLQTLIISIYDTSMPICYATIESQDETEVCMTP